MIRFRPFLNTDPPLLAEIWRGQTPLRGLAQGISSAILEKHVFSKTYFDRFGLIVAEEEDGRVLGFAHAGFGPTPDRNSLDSETGVVSRLLTIPHSEREQTSKELLRRAEDYLKQAGAKRIVAFGTRDSEPFYLGFYGGSRLPGVLLEDQLSKELFENSGYQAFENTTLLQCRLTGFRPAVSRKLMTVRRAYQLVPVVDPISANWWEACTLGLSERTRFELVPRRGGEPHGQVTFWDMEPLASSWGLHAMGLIKLSVASEHRRKGLATFLVSEALRQLASQGITVIEVQSAGASEALLGLSEKMGFSKVDEGVGLQKVIQ